MKKTITLFLLLFMPLFVMVGQETIDLSLDPYKDGYTIDKGGTYTITGTFSGTPKQDMQNGGRNAVILVTTKDPVTLILQDVNISLTGNNQCPICLKDATNVTVVLSGENTLSTTNESGQCPALWAPQGEGASLTIEGSGKLTAQGAKHWPGIGIQEGTTSNITIESGTIITKGGPYGAGIGGSHGEGGYNGTITIKGGNVMTTGGEYAPGIGGGAKGAGGTIMISGGMVTATGGIKGTFRTDPDGNAIIFASSIGDQSGKKKWKGIIFEGKAGQVYGDYTLTEGKELTIPTEHTLTIPESTYIINYGTITNNGTIDGEGKILNRGKGTVNNNMDNVVTQTLLVKSMITFDNSIIYTGSPLTPLKIDGYNVNTDYTVTYKDNTNAGEATATITPTLYGQLYGDAITKTFEIKRANPTYTTPSNLTATYGQTLKDIAFTNPDNGTWSWQDAETTSVGKVGNNIFKATFTPKDETNYNTVTDIEVTITVEKATPSYTVPTGLKATYGQTLADVLLPEGWAWNDPTTTPVGTAGDNSFSATFTPKDQVNYTTVKESLTVAVSKKALTIAWADATYEKGETITPASINGWIVPADTEGSTITYTKDGQPVALADLPVGTHEITASATIVNPNYEAPAEVKATITIEEPYVPPTPVDPEPTPEPDPIYYTITIPETITGAIIEGSGTHTVREYNSITFRIEIDPNGTGQYPTVTRGDQWWSTLTPDRNGTYRVYAYGDTEIRIGEVPGYTNYRLVLPTDSVFENDSTYWSAAGIEVSGMTALGNDIYEAPFGTSVTLAPLPDSHRTFLTWEDGTRQVPRTLLLRDDQEIRALYRKVSPVSNEAIDGLRAYTSGSTLYICTPQKTPALICTPDGRVIFSGEIEGTQRFYGLQPGVYIVQVGDRTFKLTV